MRFRSSVLHISILALGAVCAPMTVQAGFEWVAPKEDMTRSIQLPAPKPGTPRISPQPLDSVLDPLPPLSIDQEAGTRDTVYSPAPRRALPPAVNETAPREEFSAAPSPAPRMRTLNMGGPDAEPRMAGRVSPPIVDNPDQPRQLRMADKLIVPPEDYFEPPASQEPLPVAEGRVAINPAPLANPAFSVPMAAAPPQTARPAESAPSGPVLEGFGSDIPLVMALQQIVPADYTYSFASGVNPGESVSWEGGKSWAQVLSEMLEGEGLTATIRGRSIQIQAGPYAPRAESAASAVTLASAADAVADRLAETMPAAGEETAPLAEASVPAAPVAKVEAVPPVYPPEILGKKADSVSAPAAPAVPERRVLGSVSEKNGLRIEEVKETVQLHGSPEAARAARKAVSDHAAGIAQDSPQEALSASAPSIETTSFRVTKTTHKVADIPAAPAAAPVSLIPAEAEPVKAAPAKAPVKAPAEKSAALETPVAAPADIKPADIHKAVPGKIPASAVQPSRRGNITDPGEQPTRQPEVQALNLKPAATSPAPAAAVQPEARPAKFETASAADIPASRAAAAPSGSVSRNLSRDEQRKKLEDMARQQGVVLDAKNYNADTLGKIFNDGIAPAAGDISPHGSGDIESRSSVPAVLRSAGGRQGVEAVKPLVSPRAGGVQVQPPPNLQMAPQTQDAPQRLWEARKGQDLKTVLGKWCRDSGAVLMWKAKGKYEVGSGIMVHGGFNDALKALFEEGAKSPGFPVMRLTDNGAAGRVLTVESKS